MKNRHMWCGSFQLQFLCVLCLGVSALSEPAQGETLVASGAACRYQVPTNGADGTNWTTVAFDDALWTEGASGLGYDTQTTYASLFGATVPVGTVGFYARFAFVLPAGKSYDSLTLRLKYEDGFIAYLNGTEVARSNAPASAAYNSVATTDRADSLAVVFQNYTLTAFLPLLREGTNVLAVHALNNSSGSSDLLMLPELTAEQPSLFTNVVINEFMALNNATRKNSLGKYEDWVELYNPFSTNVNLGGWYLTDKATSLTKWQFPSHAASVIPSRGYLLVWADSKSYSVTNSELHASFALSGDGEYLGLVRPDGVTVAHAYAPAFPPQYADVSYGLGETGESRFFAKPTPGAGNAFDGGSNQVGGVKFSPKRGVYTNALPTVTVTPSMAESEIRYTTDAEAPTAASTLYTAPLDLTRTAVFRAAAFRSGFAPSAIDTHTYIAADDVLRQSATQAGYPATWAGYAADYELNPTVVATYGAALTNALKALPTLSLVTTVSNLFDASTGIYTHPTSTGTAWERETSAEWVDADNDSRFQVGCGLQIQGGAFRNFSLSMKKSFSLQFRSVYGEGRLEEKLFSGDAISTFDDLVLRAGANDAWNKWGHQKTQYIVDEFMRRSHLAMGGVSPHGTFVHLYLNGLYWGLYNVTEKVSSEIAAAYIGGREDTWDVRSQDAALDGNFTAWNAMVNLLPTNGVSNEAYQQVQGNNPDGTRNPAYPVYLDVGNYIDYLVLQYWSANTDWPHNNWRAFRDRIDSVSTGFKFAVWDAEAGLGVWGDLATDRTGEATGVAVMQSRLVSNAEYKLRFADRVQKGLFNGGVLTPEVTVPLYRSLAAMIEPALVAESARWGDQDGNATHTVEQWRTQRDYVLGTFLPQRGARILQFFRTRGLFPSVDAPAFAQFGGAFSNGLNLAVTAANPVYYTTDGSDPREYGTGAAAGALYTNGVVLTRTTRLKARARSAGGEWSALTEAVFTLAERPALRVTELMYHPSRTLGLEEEGYLDGEDEFIELCNAGAGTIGLAGLRFTDGVTFDFAESAVQTLAPGEYALVVRNLTAFTNRYPEVPAQRIAGAFAFPATSLNNGGEKVVLEDALGRSVVSFTYDNNWLVATDGAGHSLVPLPGVAQADGELDYPGNWRSSVFIGGSPGQGEPAAPASSLVLNEILAHTDYDVAPYDSNDGIELYNTTGAPIILGPGWYLSDDPENLTKWEIPATNSLAAHGWRWFDEVHDFHSPITNGFGLNKAGEQVLLSYLRGTGDDRVVDAIVFAGEENGVPLVRFPDGAASWFYGVLTPGASNRLTDAGVRIDEVMYHPKPTAANPENNENDEYVELVNPTAQPVTLMNPEADGGAWRLSGGIDYVFPDDTVLPAGGRLAVVSFDPDSEEEKLADFLSAYGLTNGQVRLLGPFDGHLNNKTDTVRLARPVSPDVVGDEPSWHIVDQVTYYDAAPWTCEADGTGSPLARLPGQNSGDDPASWVAGLGATPGQASAKISVTVPVQNTGYLAPVSIAVAAAVAPSFIAGGIQRVVFAVDGIDAASVSAAPYEASVALDAREGVRLITARLTDDEGDYTSAAVPVVAYTNMPGFTAGFDQMINLTVTDRIDLHAVVESLSGTTNPVQFVWSCPGDSSVVFERPTQSDASASFAQPGQYELLLTLYYGQLVTNRTITVTVSATNTLNRIPYKEGFEVYELGSTLVGVGGWYGDDPAYAVIGTNRYGAAAGGSPLSGAHTRSLCFSGSVTNSFAETGALTNICMDMLLGIESGDEAQPTIAPDVQLAFCFNEQRRVMVWHGQPGGTNRWTVLPEVTVGSNDFVRLTVMADTGDSPSGAFNFRIWVDRQAVTNPAVWFATANTNRSFLSSIELLGDGQLDDLVVDTYNSMLYRRITASAGAHGRVEPSGELFVPVGASTNISIRADSFYRVAAVRVDGQGVGPVLSVAFTNVWDEHALAADFAARLTASGVPELWLNGVNPVWTDNFDAHALEDTDSDGMPNGDEYVAGTDATQSQSVFRLALGLSNGVSVVSFPTVPYEGWLYGLSGVRRYALEQADELAGGWQGVPGLTDRVGDGQSVIHTNGFEAPVRFFRGRVWLEQ
jgi:hypothetical protein